MAPRKPLFSRILARFPGTPAAATPVQHVEIGAVRRAFEKDPAAGPWRIEFAVAEILQDFARFRIARCGQRLDGLDLLRERGCPQCIDQRPDIFLRTQARCKATDQQAEGNKKGLEGAIHELFLSVRLGCSSAWATAH